MHMLTQTHMTQSTDTHNSHTHTRTRTNTHTHAHSTHKHTIVRKHNRTRAHTRTQYTAHMRTRKFFFSHAYIPHQRTRPHLIFFLKFFLRKKKPGSDWAKSEQEMYSPSPLFTPTMRREKEAKEKAEREENVSL